DSRSPQGSGVDAAFLLHRGLWYDATSALGRHSSYLEPLGGASVVASRVENERPRQRRGNRGDEDRYLGSAVIGGAWERLSRNEERHREPNASQGSCAD